MFVGDVANALNALALVLLASRAFLAKRHVDSPVLTRFGIAFLLAALAQILALALSLGTQSAPAMRRDSFDAFDLLFWGYYASLTSGFALLLSTFTRRKWKLVLAVAPVLLVAGPIAQAAIVLLLLLVVAHSGLNHIEEARAGSLATATGYSLVLLAHAVFLLDYHPLTPRNAIGEWIHLFGVVVLVAVAFARRR